MTKRLQLGTAGCGVIGPYHARAITSLPDAELVAYESVSTHKEVTLS